MKKPDWVKNVEVPYEKIDSLGYPTTGRNKNSVTIYKEVQINIDTEETFGKDVVKVLDKSPGYHPQTFSLSHSPKDEEEKLISVSVKNDSQEVDITTSMNWSEQGSNEYVFNRLWNSYKKIVLSIDKISSQEVYSVSHLEKSLRDDTHLDAGILYSFRDSMYVYFRVISSKPLEYKTFNGFPKVTTTEHDSYFEYIAEGFAVTPFKNKVPWPFIKSPFICFSRYKNIEQVGRSFKNQFVADSISHVMLDDLYIQLTRSASNDSTKVKNIVNYVQDTLLYQDYGLIRSYQPSWCIQGSRGDCKAKSLITIELLKRAGLKAYPILVNSPEYLPQLDPIPSFRNFNHVIVQFIFNRDTIRLDPTNTEQTDKIGAYPILDFKKGLVMYEDKEELVKISAKDNDRIMIYDEVSDTVKRKMILSGKMAELYLNFRGTAPSTLFKDSFFRLKSQDNYAIHTMNYRGSFDKDTTTELEKTYHNSTSQDSLVLFHKLYSPDSTYRPYVRTKKKNYNSYTTTSFSSDPEIRDTLYTGLWPLDRINQSTVAKYHKYKIPLQKIDLSTFETNFALEHDFGYYRCKIEENDSLIIVKQDIFVSGGLPLDRLNEYEEFKENIELHGHKVSDLILAKVPEEPKKKKVKK